MSIGVAITLVATGIYAFAATTPLWKVELAKIPTTNYSRDALAYITEATQALRPCVGDDLGESRLEPVLADIGVRYFDGARLSGTAHAEVAFDNLQHFGSYLKGRLSGPVHPAARPNSAT